MSPRRTPGKEGRRDLDAFRARLVDAQRATTRQGKDRPPKARRREVSPDEPAGEADAEDDSGRPPGRWWEHEDAGRPRPVEGGIVARTRKGPIGSTWWSRRFLGSLESVMVGGRMERGRAYARKGQVVDLQIGSGLVAATVQGSREDPYGVRLRMPVVPDEDWDRILRALGTRAGYAARMLAGDLPHDVEEVFASEGSSLLPTPHSRLVTECTCPDWENPCKHVAAVCYLLAEGFDRDPFALLAWRGRSRAEVLGAMRAIRLEDAAAPEEAGVDAASSAAPATGDDPGGHRDPFERFWTAGPELARVRVLPEEAPVPTAVLRLAPRGTVSVRGGDLVDVLAPAYRTMAAAAAARARR